MEDYEKKYKNALEIAKSMIDDLRKGEDILAVSDLEEMFPELNESEDEKIRKEIIEFVDINTLSVDGRHDRWIAWLEKQCYTKKDVDDAYLKGISDAKNELEKQGKQDARYRCLEELLAADDIYQMSVNDTMTNEAKEKAAKALSKLCIGKLLGFEKQGEQKTAVTDFNAKDWYVSKVDGKIHDMTYNPADKVEPKFHEGEWIVWKNKCYKVNYNGCGYELVDQNGLSTSLEYGTVDENAHLWDITKDAKDGDVLISQYGNPLIYNGNYNSLNIGAYCGITCGDNKFKVAEEKCHWTENVDIKPATKEQRDTLMKAMADAGYTFDFEKKELKKIEQNPTWSEEDERICQCLIKDQEESLDEVRNDKYGHSEIISDLKEMYRERINWLKSLKTRTAWKPNEKQIHAFEQVYKWYNNNFAPSETLTSLYNDLKKF